MRVHPDLVTGMGFTVACCTWWGGFPHLLLRSGVCLQPHRRRCASGWPHLSHPMVFRPPGDHVGLPVPVVIEVAHDQGVVEGDAACGECGFVGEEG